MIGKILCAIGLHRWDWFDVKGRCGYVLLGLKGGKCLRCGAGTQRLARFWEMQDQIERDRRKGRQSDEG